MIMVVGPCRGICLVGLVLLNWGSGITARGGIVFRFQEFVMGSWRVVIGTRMVWLGMVWMGD